MYFVCTDALTDRPTDQPTPHLCTHQAHALRSLAAVTSSSIPSNKARAIRTPSTTSGIIPTPFGGLGLLGAMRAFSVGFGGLQYDTLVEMQEK